MTGSPSQRNGGTGAGRPGRRAPRGSVPLGRIAGMPLYLQSSWLIVCLLVVVLYGPIVRRSMPELGIGAYAVAFGFCLLLGISVLLHELAHAGAARAFGWPVDRIVLSLMGGHTAFGRTSPRWGASAVVSIVGPVVNLLIAVVGFAVLPGLGEAAQAEGALAARICWSVLSLTSTANLLVGMFNLVPGLPLDGGRVVEALVWGLTGRERLGTVAAAWTGRLTAVAIVTAVLLLGLWQRPLSLIVAGLLVWMLISGAADGLRRSKASAAMEGRTALSLSQPAVGIPAGLSLRAVEQTAMQLEPGTSVVGMDDGLPVGVLDGARLGAVPAQDRAASPLSSALLPIGPAAILPEELCGHDLLEAAVRCASPVMVIVDAEGTVTGTLAASRLNTLLEHAGLIGSDGSSR